MKKLFWLPVVFIIMFSLGSCQSGVHTALNLTEFKDAIAKKNIVILDVRTPEEFQTGHLENALLANWNDEPTFKSTVASLDKSTPVYVYCLSGGRSNEAVNWLNEQGYHAFGLSGGINGWIQAGLPVEQVVQTAPMSMTTYLAKIPVDKTVLVDISAVWCPPCKKMAPIVDELGAQADSNLVIINVDGGTQPGLCQLLKIEAFPTFLVYKHGQEVWRKQGITDIRTFKEHL